MKKILIALMLMSLSTGAIAGEMEDTLLSIEKDIDTCIESNDKNVCDELTFAEDYLVKFMGNQDYMKDLVTKCQIGTECASIMYRLVAKMSTALTIQMDL